MLRSLSISNYALIDTLEITFPEGLVIITGETGAGKSILLGAMSLLLGAKADKDILKDNSKNCVVEAVFDLDPDFSTHEIFQSNSIDSTNELIIRRIVSPNGKTRSFVNDQPVGVQFLKEISDKIIDIHAQHEHLLIGDSRFQLSVLDSYAKNRKELEAYRIAFSTLKELEADRDSLKDQIAREEQELEYNRYQLKQLEEANLFSGELEELEAEYKILVNAEEIKSDLHQAILHLNPNEISVVQGLREIVSLLGRVANNIPEANELAERVESSRIELKDIESELSLLSSKINVLPERLQQLEERISLLYDLLKKFRAESIEELIRIKEEIARQIIGTDDNKERLEILNKRIDEVKSERDSCSAKLTSARKGSAKAFSQELAGKIRELEMPHAEFNVSVTESTGYHLFGKDDVTFTFSANKNIVPRELSKVASGGELSRIMLCLKAAMATENRMPTLIFDEIDSGVSGSIAEKMGLLIDQLSRNMQVFAITHLPQIASKGDFHLLVYKDSDSSGRAATRIKEIKSDERLNEIARMLSGTGLTRAAIENAKEFLKT